MKMIILLFSPIFNGNKYSPRVPTRRCNWIKSI